MKQMLKQAVMPLAIGLACLSNYVNAAEYILDTNTGFVFRDGLYVNNINGVHFSSSLISGGIYQFSIAGDLNLGADDSLVGRGGRGASIVVANNANIHANAIIDFSNGKGGGGIGGEGGDGGFGGEGGPGGRGGREAYVNIHNFHDPRNSNSGRGGLGNVPTCVLVCKAGFGSFGGEGEDGINGVRAGSGQVGQSGQHGRLGLNNPLISQGQGAQTNLSGLEIGGHGGHGGDGGHGGIGEVGGFVIAGASNGKGSPGEDGSNGRNGKLGETGRYGTDGTGGLNLASGFDISGGSGGGGGSGGSGGGGGGGSGGGGAGGGGGGGGGTLTFPFYGRPVDGARGGNGGAGADGATGGTGGTGRTGGSGGAGGGALELIVRGELNAAGHFTAQGGDGQNSSGNRTGENGDSGTSGSGGHFGPNGLEDWDLGYATAYSGAGGDGGDGGDSNRGGDGGDGGVGGAGGGGAGGTIKLVASVINASGATVDTSGGNNGESNQGGDGRFITGSNASTGGPVLSGASTKSAPTGVMGENPYHKTPGTLIPFIPNLVGGAETFGLLDGIDSQHSVFNSFLDSKPADGIGALLRLDVGPLDYAFDFIGFDMLLFMSLSDGHYATPMLGIDPSGSNPNFLVNLMRGGFAKDLSFGGLGDTILDFLGPFKIFATLISESDNFFNATFGDASLSSTSLQNGQIAFLRGSSIVHQDPIEIGGPGSVPDPTNDPTAVPEPSSFALFAVGLLFLVVRRRHIV